MDKLLMTPEEAADTLSIGRTKVYELLQLGLLRSVQIGKSRRIPIEAIHDLIKHLAGDVDAPTSARRSERDTAP